MVQGKSSPSWWWQELPRESGGRLLWIRGLPMRTRMSLCGKASFQTVVHLCLQEPKGENSSHICRQVVRKQNGPSTLCNISQPQEMKLGHRLQRGGRRAESGKDRCCVTQTLLGRAVGDIVARAPISDTAGQRRKGVCPSGACSSIGRDL